MKINVMAAILVSLLVGVVIFVAVYVVEKDEAQREQFCLEKGFQQSQYTSVEKYCYTELDNGTIETYDYKEVEYAGWRKRQ